MNRYLRPLLVAAAMLFGAACTAVPRLGGGEITLTFARSNAPAANVVAAFPAGDTYVRVRADAQGRVLAPPLATRAILIDESLDTAITEVAVRRGAAIEVPELVRFRGSVAGANAIRRLSVHLGSGPRDTAVRRYRAMQSRAPEPDDGVLAGVPLPAASSQWRELQVGSDGTFTTPWVPAAQALQLLAFDRDGNSVLVDVPAAKDAAHGATLDVPAMTLLPRGVLELDVDVRMDGVELYLSIANARVDPDSRDAFAAAASVLDRTRLRTFELLAGENRQILAPGRNRITGLPPLASADVWISIEGGRRALAKKQVDFTALSAPIRVSERDFVDVRDLPSTTMSGTVVLAGTGAPLGHARVIYRDDPMAQETTTAADGTFVLRGMPAGIPVALNVIPADAQSAGARGSFLFRFLTAVQNAPPLRLEMPLAEPAANPVDVIACGNLVAVDDPQFPLCVGYRSVMGQYTLEPVTSCFWIEATQMATIEVPTAGTWNFYVWMRPFIRGSVTAVDVPQANTPVEAEVAPQGNFITPATVTFFRGAFMVVNVEAAFSGASDVEADPYTFNTTKLGVISLNCIDIDTVNVFICSKGWYFYAAQTFQDGRAIVQVEKNQNCP